MFFTTSADGGMMLGVIGGSGLYNVDCVDWVDEKNIDTPFGRPSDTIKIGVLNTEDGQKVAFLPRHGYNHQFPPHMVNYRANLWALKKLGVDSVLAFSAVGSLKEDYKRGHVCIARHYIDFTKIRKRTFYDDRAVHISMADPYCPRLSKLAYDTAKLLKIPVHDNVIYVCIEGPMFSTRAESNMYRMLGGGIIGMTGCPETQLARELGLCYASINTVTDYDCWKGEVVSADLVLKTIKENDKNIKNMMIEIIKNLKTGEGCNCAHSLEGAML